MYCLALINVGCRSDSFHMYHNHYISLCYMCILVHTHTHRQCTQATHTCTHARTHACTRARAHTHTHTHTHTTSTLVTPHSTLVTPHSTQAATYANHTKDNTPHSIYSCPKKQLDLTMQSDLRFEILILCVCILGDK